MANNNSNGHNISSRQQLVEQLTEKQAITLSQKPTNKIPLKVCDHPATWIMIEPDADMETLKSEWNFIHNPPKVVIEGNKYNKLRSIRVR